MKQCSFKQNVIYIMHELRVYIQNLTHEHIQYIKSSSLKIFTNIIFLYVFRDFTSHTPPHVLIIPPLYIYYFFLQYTTFIRWYHVFNIDKCIDTTMLFQDL